MTVSRQLPLIKPGEQGSRFQDRGQPFLRHVLRPPTRLRRDDNNGHPRPGQPSLTPSRRWDRRTPRRLSSAPYPPGLNWRESNPHATNLVGRGTYSRRRWFCPVPSGWGSGWRGDAGSNRTDISASCIALARDSADFPLTPGHRMGPLNNWSLGPHKCPQKMALGPPASTFQISRMTGKYRGDTARPSRIRAAKFKGKPQAWPLNDALPPIWPSAIPIGTKHSRDSNS